MKGRKGSQGAPLSLPPGDATAEGEVSSVKQKTSPYPQAAVAGALTVASPASNCEP
jgi:hypothetical protein